MAAKARWNWEGRASTTEELHAHYATQLREVTRLLRTLHEELKHWENWNDDELLSEMLNGTWQWNPTLGDFRFIAQMLEIYVRDDLKGKLGLYEKEAAERDKNRGVDGVNVVDILDPKIARLNGTSFSVTPPR
jgi:hypothetical protein